MNEEFWNQVQQLLVEQTPEPIEYRLHYDQLGQIYMCSMQQHPADTDYLVVDKNIYERYFDFIVKSGKLTEIERDAGYRRMLNPADQNGKFKVLRGHAGIIIEDENTDNIELEYYEYRNN